MSWDNTYTPLKRDITAKPKWPVPMQPHPTTGVLEYILEGDIKERFINLFPIHSNRRIMTWFGISCSTVQRFKRQLGLQKNMKAVRKELARDIKRKCEANGYYASLRGQSPSRATIDAIKRLRAEGFTPMNVFREKHPKKFRDMMKKRSEERKELVRKEHLRMKYGLGQQSNLNLTLTPLSHRAASQKCVMIKKNNYFADPDHPTWVCYDSDTRRSAQREATAVRYGLRIVEGEDNL